MAMEQKKIYKRPLATFDRLPKVPMPIVKGNPKGKAVLTVKVPYQGFSAERRRAYEAEKEKGAK